MDSPSDQSKKSDSEVQAGPITDSDWTPPPGQQEPGGEAVHSAEAAGPPSPPSDFPVASAPSTAEAKIVEERVIAALRTCYDPEIPVDIYELGLVYSVQVKPEGAVSIQMTLTSPACPVAGSLPPEVEAKVRAVPGVAAATVEVVWDPPWNPSMMSEAAKLQLNMM